MAIGGQNNYPSLNDIANLARSLVNDDKAGATGTPGEGQILVNSSVTLQNLMNSAIRETYRDIRIMGQTTLIRDNYILYDLTPVNSALGVGVMNPAVQVSLSALGYFDGLMTNPDLLLPGDLIFPLEMWERQNGSNNPFGMMQQSTGALTPRNQTQSLGQWEWRTDQIWMNGATQSRDIRLRYICTYVSLAAPDIDWNNTFVPIMDSQEAIADKITVRYSARLGGDSLQYAMQKADTSIMRLRQQVTRTRQEIDFQRPAFGNGAGLAGNPASNWLY
jgi:hypothetical protein